MKETTNQSYAQSVRQDAYTQTAVLDTAHLGPICGALGTIQAHEHPRNHKSIVKKLLFFLAIMGPGLIVMVGDNDAGGVATYTQAGQNYGASLLWVLLLLIPVLIVNQEMVVRLGAVTGVGHARLIFARFGKFWGFFSAGDLLILNFLTIITEFIGVSLGMSYLGVSPYISVPSAALILIMTTLTGSFKRWEQFMYGFIAFTLLMIPLAFMAHPTGGAVLHGMFIPGIKGGLNSTALLLIIGIVGTTVAPWQLFFQQSNIIDKRITPRWIQYERWDTVIGSLVTVGGATALMVAAAFAFQGTKFASQFTNAGGVAFGIGQTLGSHAGTVFAIILIAASIIGAAAVTLSTSYAFGDIFNRNHSLHRSVKDAKLFYVTYTGLVVVAAGIVLIPHVPLGLITLAVQALAGILLPSATVFLVLLCNDKHVLGPWTNPRWLNVVASVIIGTLVALSFILAATTLFPNINGVLVSEWSGVVLIAGLLGAGLFYSLKPKKPLAKKIVDEDEKMNWRMKPLDKLPKPHWSAARKFGMYTMRGYLALAVLLMVIKVINLASGH